MYCTDHTLAFVKQVAHIDPRLYRGQRLRILWQADILPLLPLKITLNSWKTSRVAAISHGQTRHKIGDVQVQVSYGMKVARLPALSAVSATPRTLLRLCIYSGFIVALRTKFCQMLKIFSPQKSNANFLN